MSTRLEYQTDQTYSSQLLIERRIELSKTRTTHSKSDQEFVAPVRYPVVRTCISFQIGVLRSHHALRRQRGPTGSKSLWSPLSTTDPLHAGQVLRNTRRSLKRLPRSVTPGLASPERPLHAGSLSSFTTTILSEPTRHSISAR